MSIQPTYCTRISAWMVVTNGRHLIDIKNLEQCRLATLAVKPCQCASSVNALLIDISKNRPTCTTLGYFEHISNIESYITG